MFSSSATILPVKSQDRQQEEDGEQPFCHVGKIALLDDDMQ